MGVCARPPPPPPPIAPSLSATVTCQAASKVPFSGTLLLTPRSLLASYCCFQPT